VVRSIPVAAGISSDQDSPPTAAAETASQADSAASPVAVVVNANHSQPAAPETTISVTPGRTLLGICVEQFGSCNTQLLQEIHRLNPRLSNLDHIETGQKILLPPSAAKQNITQLQGSAPLRERGTNE
jgi:hypothetical protein